MSKIKYQDCTREYYDQKMDEFRKRYGNVWNAPKWARDEIRKLRIVEPDAGNWEQGVLPVPLSDTGVTYHE
jgi:hypothetical protein